MKKRSAKLADSASVRSREARIEELERAKMSIKCQMEDVMKRYAKLTGLSSLKKRKYKLGSAPNDWQPKR